MENYSALEKTLLPFINTLTAAKIFGLLAILIVAVYVIRAVVYKHALNLKRAPSAEAFYLLLAVLFNTSLYTFFYWYWALPVSAAISIVFMSATAHEVKESNTELRMGIWGLNKDIRTVRAEIFADMSPEDQIEYSKGVKEYRFIRWRFLAVAILVPVIVIFVWYFSNIGYLFFPVAI